MNRGAGHLFSRCLFWGWAIPLVLLALPIASFNLADPFWSVVSVATIVAAWCACRLAEARTPAAQRMSVRLPLPGRCRRAVYLFSLLTVVGSALILFDQQGTLGDLQLQNLQQRYIAMTEIANAGDRLGTGLSTIGTVLRSLVYVAIVAMVALSAQERRLRRYALPLLALLMALVLSAVATASRTYLIFSLVVTAVAGIATQHRIMRQARMLLVGGLLCAVFISITTAQRLEQTLGDMSVAEDYLTGFFEVDLPWLGQLISSQLGVPVLTLLLYLSHSLPEFSKLVADGSTQYAFGGHSLYLIVGPGLRLLGYPLPPVATESAERLGMWWSMLGDLYLDLGEAFVVAYPLAIFLMVRASLRLGAASIYALTIKCLTGAMLFASAYFGVLNTYSFSYLLLLGLATLHATLRQRQRTVLPSAEIKQGT